MCTVLSATRRRWTCLALTLAEQAGTCFIYPRGMEGWVGLDVSYMPRWSTCPQTVAYASTAGSKFFNPVAGFKEKGTRIKEKSKEKKIKEERGKDKKPTACGGYTISAGSQTYRYSRVRWHRYRSSVNSGKSPRVGRQHSGSSSCSSSLLLLWRHCDVIRRTESRKHYTYTLAMCLFVAAANGECCREVCGWRWRWPLSEQQYCCH